MELDLKLIEESLYKATRELIEFANLRKGQIMVLGASTSEVAGKKIGSASSMEIGMALVSGIKKACDETGINLAVQACEHINRSLVVESEVAFQRGLEIVTVLPHPKAGGAAASSAYKLFKDPVMVEKISADAGIDVGHTLIGMHLHPVVVPVRLELEKVGNAPVVFARTRPKLIGGERAHYPKDGQGKGPVCQ